MLNINENKIQMESMIYMYANDGKNNLLLYLLEMLESK